MAKQNSEAGGGEGKKGDLCFHERQAVDVLIKQNRGKNISEQLPSLGDSKSLLAQDLIKEVTILMEEDEKCKLEEQEKKAEKAL